MERYRWRRQAHRSQDRYRYRKSVKRQRGVGAGRAVRVHRRFFRRTSGLVLPIGGELMRIGFHRMVAEMLGCAARFMLAIGRNHAPAELKSEDC